MMRSLIDRLPEEIAELEAKFGSDDPYVKDLKEQLRASKANQGKSTQEVYYSQMQAPMKSSTMGDNKHKSEK